MFTRQLPHKFILLSFVFVLITVFGSTVQGAKKGKDRSKDQYAIDEATLQSHVMSFADRFFSIMASEFQQYIGREPSKKNRYDVQRLVTYSLSQAYIIAAEDDPGVALLDVTAMVMLGRMIFEEEGIKRYGSRILPIINGYKMAEKDIMQIAAKVLPAGQLKNLRIIVRRWRQSNPEVLFFPLVRSSNSSVSFLLKENQKYFPKLRMKSMPRI